MDGGEQLLRPGALEQEAGRAGVDGAEDVVVLLEGGEDEDLDVGVSRRAAGGWRRSRPDPGMRTSISDEIGVYGPDALEREAPG